MTKYRRKTANAKERDRMKQLNVAFDRLRGVMPDVKTITKEEKDTKVKNPLLNIQTNSFQTIKLMVSQQA